jgi:methanol metabolism-related c-type cytochrome
MQEQAMNHTMMAVIAALLLAHSAAPARAQDNVTAAYEQDGKHFTAEDIPTFKIADDGTVDWYTFSGFRRYHSECQALAKSALAMDYFDFVDVVVNGRVHGNSVMPAFGTNLNVMCYLDDIYIYLKAVGTEAIPRGRPQKKAEKPDAFTEAEDVCMG